MDTSTLSQEMESLNAQIQQVQSQIVKLDGELRALDSEFESFAIEKQRIDALRETCDALDKLGAMGADDLFWGKADGAGHKKQLRARISTFEEETRGVLEQREFLQGQIEQHNGELDLLFDELWDVEAQEKQRQDEFLIVRELTLLPYRPMLMPWSKEVESEKRFRKALLVSMFWSLLLSIVVHLVTVPLPDREAVMVKIPDRLAMLVKDPLPKPAPIPERPEEQKKVESEPEKPVKAEQTAKAEKTSLKKDVKAKPAGGGKKGAKKKVANVGVLAFKSSFSDLMDEVPVAKLGTEARLKKPDSRIPGQARAHRSLVAMQATGGGSRGISNFGVSRDLGNGGKGGGSGYGTAGQIGGVGTAKVQSAVAGLAEEAGRPLSDGLGAARTDEEIQIVFDRYKATLYRIYNKELRKDPTLRGKLLLRLTIEPGGEVSFCRAESTDLASSELVAKIVDRVKRFNFGKKDVAKVTILYPIDFLPAG